MRSGALFVLRAYGYAPVRREKGYTQREVANRLELSEKTISKWECGKGLPEVVYMEPLSSLLGISVNELLAGERIPILELIRKMDETRIELVTQLSFEQLTVFSVRTDEKMPDPGKPCGRNMKRNSDTDSPHSFGLSVLFYGHFSLRKHCLFTKREGFVHSISGKILLVPCLHKKGGKCYNK